MHGMCRPAVDRTRRHRGEGSGTVAVANREPGERLTDADRQDATDLLSAAFRDGILRVDDFDQRLTAALAADVAGDLAVVTGDLPASWLAERDARERSQRRAAAHRRRWSAEVRTYAAVMALLVTIWLLTSLDGDLAHPWPVWPALGWGIPLFLSRPRGGPGRDLPRWRAAREF